MFIGKTNVYFILLWRTEKGRAEHVARNGRK